MAGEFCITCMDTGEDPKNKHGVCTKCILSDPSQIRDAILKMTKELSPEHFSYLSFPKISKEGPSNSAQRKPSEFFVWKFIDQYQFAEDFFSGRVFYPIGKEWMVVEYES